MSIVDTKALQLYAENGINVLLEGHHGVGKTAIIKEIFSKAFGEINKDWLYFSGSTMDAWTNFIGCPKSVKEEDGTEVLDIIPPKQMARNTIKAIFIDEYNRAPKAVRNAVMELLQFKSINGRSFDNMKVVWAAINPHDDEETYDVEKLDPAQEDRFEIQISIPYKLNAPYLKSYHGEIATPFIEWWNALNKESKMIVSPRRLDKAITVYRIGGNLSHVFNKKVNVTDLQTRIAKSSIDVEFNDFLKQPLAKIKTDLGNPDVAIRFADKLSNVTYKKYWKYINEELIASSSNQEIVKIRNSMADKTKADAARKKARSADVTEMGEFDYIDPPKQKAVKSAQALINFKDKSTIVDAINSINTKVPASKRAVFLNRTLNRMVSKLSDNNSSLSELDYSKLLMSEIDSKILSSDSFVYLLEDVFKKSQKLSNSDLSLTGHYARGMKNAFLFLRHSSVSSLANYANSILRRI